MQRDLLPDNTDQRGARVIDLSLAPGERQAWGRPSWMVYLWGAVEIIFVTNPWQISSSLRIKVLRLFGAEIGEGVIFRPRTRVRFPWKLHIGSRTWIGEGVWFHNQDHVHVGSDVVISQESFLTTGSHAVRLDMGLLTKPIHIEDGAWVTARCIILGGASIGKSAVLTPGTVVKAGENIPEGAVFGPPPGKVLGTRYRQEDQQQDIKGAR
ncbi:acetyltransferase [Arthrobacter sp. Leaf145]|nr:acetyltransferase [Arthrobacter sp. Leaf145]